MYITINTNFLLTEHDGHTGEHWPEVHTKTTKGQYSPVWLELARLVSSLLYGTLALNLTAFENQKYAAYDCFYGTSPNGKILTKKEPIRMLRFTSRLPCHIIILYCN